LNCYSRFKIVIEPAILKLELACMMFEINYEMFVKPDRMQREFTSILNGLLSSERMAPEFYKDIHFVTKA